MSLRVLLISPVPEIDPACGDVTYTEGLLKHPPAGVEYETYADAIAAGRLRELGRREDLKRSSGVARLPALGRVVREHGINALRQRGWLFREPFRDFVVEPGAYDLVHCHLFSARFRRLEIPLVISNAIAIDELYRGPRGWSATRVRAAAKADDLLARALRVQHTAYRMPKADAVVCFTETLRQEMIRRGAASVDRLHVVRAL